MKSPVMIRPISAIAGSLLAAGLAWGAPASTKAPGQAAPPAPLASAVDHWRSLRFGMFIHWGPVSLSGKEIGWSRGAGTPVEEYDQLYKRFRPDGFDADAWVALAKEAGMKYIVLTTKHHDGFCLWPSKLTDYHIGNTPFRRDVVKELAAACRRQGIEFGAYYSVCDWHHPDFPLTSPGGRVKREKSDLDAYNRYLLGQIRELVTGYGPLLTIWNDVPQEFRGRGAETIRMVRALQPDILINNRTGDGGDYDTPEQKIGGFNMDRPWESCMTLSAHNHWAWGGAKDGVKPLEACLRMLVLGNGGDGNILLNVGPTPEGVIAPEQAGRLREIGGWLKQYGVSLIGTRGGPYRPTADFASTRSGKSIYLHFLKGGAGEVRLADPGAKVRSATVLTGGSVRVVQDAGACVLTLGPRDPSVIDVIVRLDLDVPAIGLKTIP